MMFTPWGPSAVPTGGAGVAAPACSWTLTSAAIFFLGGIPLVSFWVVRRGRHEPDRLCHLVVAVTRTCWATWPFWSFFGRIPNPTSAGGGGGRPGTVPPVVEEVVLRPSRNHRHGLGPQAP